MALHTEIYDLRDMEPALDRIRTFTAEIQKAAEQAMHISVNLFEAEVMERTPVGATGILRNSIFGEVAEITGQEVVGRVGSPEIYALPVEAGTRPHWAPKGALLQWVERVLGFHGKEAERMDFVIRRAIARRGTSAQARKKHGTDGYEMFKRGWKASEPRIRKIWRNLGFKAIRKNWR